MLDVIRDEPGIAVGAVSARFEMSRIGVIKHLRVLEDAGLLTSRKEGRTRHLYFNVVPIQQIYERWTSDYSGLWAARLTNLKARVEAKANAQEENV